VIVPSQPCSIMAHDLPGDKERASQVDLQGTAPCHRRHLHDQSIAQHPDAEHRSVESVVPLHYSRMPCGAHGTVVDEAPGTICTWQDEGARRRTWYRMTSCGQGTSDPTTGTRDRRPRTSYRSGGDGRGCFEEASMRGGPCQSGHHRPAPVHMEVGAVPNSCHPVQRL
jgi:hypothetical protein